MSDLIERVARRLDPTVWIEPLDPAFVLRRVDSKVNARAAIREVAEWINETGYSESEYWADILKSRLEETK